MFYIFDGDDEFSRQEELAALKAGLGPADMLSLNTTILDGARVGFDELRHTCDTVPFFTDARLVIVEGLLTRFHAPPRKGKVTEGEEDGTGDPAPMSEAQKAFRDRLLEYLPSLPAATRLVFLEPALLPAKDAFVRLVQAEPKTGARKTFVLPNLRRREGQEELANWIRARAKRKGAKIDERAVGALAQLIGNDHRLMDSELEKLAVYCQGSAITEDDVKALVSLAREAVVWDLVNAIGQKNLKAAMGTLRRLLDEGEPPLRVFGLIVREYRLLTQAKTLAAGGEPAERVASRLGIQPWMAERLLGTARGASLEQLKATYRLLLDVDVSIKTGLQEAEAALEFLVAGLCR
jgi:DNA polymerase-3 subunit delta